MNAPDRDVRQPLAQDQPCPRRTATKPHSTHRNPMRRIASDLLHAASLTVMAALSTQAFAFGAVVQYEGEIDDRVVYVADLRYMLNRTPPAMVGGDLEIRELPVTAVYENAGKPEFVHMKLQFQCTVGKRPNKSDFKLAESKNLFRASNTFRVGAGSGQERGQACRRFEDEQVRSQAGGGLPWSA